MNASSGLLAIMSIVVSASMARTDDSATVFNQRILPIFKSPNPSSCVQCHLSSVDLKDYILPSATDTFVALRNQDLIDLDAPERSKILALINRGAEQRSGQQFIPAKQRQAEYEAFAAWIKACAADPALRGLPKSDKPPTLSLKAVEVVRHSRADRVLASFESNIWAMRFRCMNCHSEGTPQCEKLRKENGDRVAWFKKDGPKATMEYLLESKLIDLTAPEKSLLLAKPLGAVKHGGGIKFTLGDQGYKAFRTWIDDVAAMRTGKYIKSEDLPKEIIEAKRFGSEAWLKLVNTPQVWTGKLLQVDVYGWDATVGGWEKNPVATTDRLIGGKGGLWQHTLTLLAEPGSKRATTWATGKPSLPPGKYLLKVYVDTKGKTKENWKTPMGPKEYVGQVEVQARWAEGYGAMTNADAGKLKR